MAKLIDADALIAWIKGSQQMTSKMKCVIAKIETMPDAVSVVRCKDCIHFDGFDCNRFGEPAEYNNPCSDDGNDFCSYGERRTDE